MTALVLKKSNDSSEAKGNGERRCRYAFKEEENQSSCNKAEKFYEIVNPILKEQQNKWQKKILEVRQSLTEEKE